MGNSIAHTFAYITSQLFPEHLLNKVLQLLFIKVGLLHYRSDIKKEELLPRSWFFIQEAKKQNITCEVAYNAYGATSHIRLTLLSGKKIYIESLPNASHTHTRLSGLIDDKAATKKILKQYQIPIAEGSSFWWFQKKKALTCAKTIGFPVIIKPSNGSVSCHVTTHITNKEQLDTAITHALRYGPNYIVERHVSGYVVRGTVINNSYLACLQQIPAHVVGDGHTTIQKLITQKNTHKKNVRLYHDIIIDDTTHELLKDTRYTLDSIPKAGESIMLQKDPFLKLGGDLKDITDETHPDNKELFFKLATIFSLKLVGIDFIIPDISKSWKTQKCAILELNSNPAIEMHHVPSMGTPRNPAGALVAMMLQYY